MTTTNSSTSVLLGDIQVHGNSDYLTNYETDQVFQPGEKISAGLNGNIIQLFSSADPASYADGNTDAAANNDNSISAVFGLELPDPKNSNVKQQTPVSITDQDNSFSGLTLKGYDVMQNAPISYNNIAQTHLIVYGEKDNKTHVLYKADPLNAQALPAADVFQLAVNPQTQKTQGFFATYAGVVQDQLVYDTGGVIGVTVQDEQQKPAYMSLSNYAYPGPAFPTKMLDFTFTYYQNQTTGADYLLLVFLLKITDPTNKNAKNQVKLLAYDRAKQGATPTQTTLTLSFTDNDFNPTSLSSFQTGDSFPEIFIGGNQTGGKGYAVHQLDYTYDTSNNTLAASADQLFAVENGSLESFHIGRLNPKMPNDAEFWGEVSYNDGQVKILTNATSDNGVWGTTIPIAQVSRFNYLCDRVSGAASVFACPADSEDTSIPTSSLLNYNLKANQMVHIWSDLQSNALRSSPVKVPGKAVRKYGASATYLNFTDASSHPVANQSFQLTASTKTFAKVNGQQMQLNAGGPATVTTNNLGRIEIIRESTALDSEDFYLTTTGVAEKLQVATRANAQGYLKTRKVPNDSDGNAKKLANNISAKNNGQDLVPLSIIGGSQSAVESRSAQSVVANAMPPITFNFNNGPGTGLGGILDDLFDDIVSGLETLANDASKFVAAAENVIDDVESIVVDAEKMVVNFAEKAVHMFLNTVEDVWHAIKFVLKKLVSAVEDLINLIGAWFEILETIKPATRFFANFFNLSLDQLINELDSAETQAKINTYTGEISQLIAELTGAQSAPSKPAHNGTAHSGFFGSSVINYIFSHLAEAFGTTSEAALVFDILEDIAQLVVDALNTITDAVDGVLSLITNLDDFHNQVESLIATLGADFIKALKDLDKTLLDVFAAMAKAIGGLKTLIEGELDIPIISDLFEDLLDEKFSFLNLIAFIIAVPTVVLYDVVAAFVSSLPDNPLKEWGDTSGNKKLPANYGELMVQVGLPGDQPLFPLVDKPGFSNLSTDKATPPADDSATSLKEGEGLDALEVTSFLFTTAGVGVNLMKYFLVSLPQAEDEDAEPSKWDFALKTSSILLGLTNTSLGIARAEGNELYVNLYLGFWKTSKMLMGLAKNKKNEKDLEVALAILSFLNLGAFAFSSHKGKDALKIVHPVLDFFADYALKRSIKTSVALEGLALGITLGEAIAGLIEE